MPGKPILTLLSLFICALGFSQSFAYTTLLKPIHIQGFPGLQSYAYAQHNGKWLILGGRKEGIHARQPFASFPVSKNNTDIYVVDIQSRRFWQAPLENIPSLLKDQLSATNINFYQQDDTLYLVGGYGYSSIAGDHITFANLTTLIVSEVIDAVINQSDYTAYMKQISDPVFAVTGGQLGMIKNKFYLVGGQKFDGRYNPMGHGTFIQEYTNQVRIFSVNNSNGQLSFHNYTSFTDPVHLRRRDYNLIPQIFPDRSEGYTISSGVFQQFEDLPFLYPVDIKENGYQPITGFNQYLNNYHSAKIALYDSLKNQMHTLFFGGISQYYYKDGVIKQDDGVPFVKTISRLTRNADGSLHEYLMAGEMPTLSGAGAELIPNNRLPHFKSKIIRWNQVTGDTVLLGHIVGGITSPYSHAFITNRTAVTYAESLIYEVMLVKSPNSFTQEVDGDNPFSFKFFPNPAKGQINIDFELKELVTVDYYLSTATGQLIKEGRFSGLIQGRNIKTLDLPNSLLTQTIFITLVFDSRFFVSDKLIKNP